MNSVQDHPDIEKIATDTNGMIDGIPVRETIREIFRNPDNGTPDNISKAGCLALALKSNEVGGAGKGYVVWNAWRRVFPLRPKEDFFPLLKRKNYPSEILNRVDFSNQKLNNFSKFDFSKFDFPPFTDFHAAHFDHDVSFKKAVFGDAVSFKGAIFGNRTDFNGVKFKGAVNFDCVRFEDQTDFAQADIDVGYFNACQFGRYTSFSYVQFGVARFSGTQFGSETSFNGACFRGEARFWGVSWGELRQFFIDDFSYESARDWAKARELCPQGFESIYFSGTRFEGEVDFSNRHFKGRTFFAKLTIPNKMRSAFDALDNKKSTVFCKPPKFHGCELHQDTSFEGAKFPDPTGREEAARAYRTLKLAFSKQQAIREEQRFFRLEMEEETLRETGLKRLLFKAYKTFSDYGFSVARPMLYLAFLPIAWMTLGYACLSLFQLVPSGVFLHKRPESTWLAQILHLSLTSALPIPGIDLAKELRSSLFGNGVIASIALILEMLQKILSLTGLFLAGLALRNLFKLK